MHFYTSKDTIYEIIQLFNLSENKDSVLLHRKTGLVIFIKNFSKLLPVKVLADDLQGTDISI